MLELNGKINMFLPFAEKDFEEVSLLPAGNDWLQRYHNIKIKANVSYITEEGYLGHDQLFRYASLVICGKAHLDASSEGTTTKLLIVLDSISTRKLGGARDIFESWVDLDNVNRISLEELRESIPDCMPDLSISAYESKLNTVPIQREMKSMLFADIKGFSTITDEVMPYFVYTFLDRVVNHLKDIGQFEKPVAMNTWGDAIFVVMDKALPLAKYALALLEVIEETDWRTIGLNEKMEIRIALHMGPVFKATNPFTSREDYFGAHVNRAARIEPKTLPGHIYASEQFTAIMTEEITHSTSIGNSNIIQSTYVGIIKLPKDFGLQRVYSLSRAKRKTK